MSEKADSNLSPFEKGAYIFEVPLHPLIFFLAWFMTVFVPLIFLKHLVAETISDSEKSISRQVDEELFDEMENFESDLSVGNQIQNAMRETLGELRIPMKGIIRGSALSGKENPGIFNLQTMNALILLIHKRLGTKPLAVIMSERDLQATHVFFNRRNFPRNPLSQKSAEMIMINHTGILERTPLGSQNHFARIQKTWMNRKDTLEKISGQFKRTAFGEFFPTSFPSGQTTEFYSPKFGEGRMFLFSLTVTLDKSRKSPILGSMLVLFHSQMFTFSGILKRAREKIPGGLPRKDAPSKACRGSTPPRGDKFQRQLRAIYCVDPPNFVPGIMENKEFRFLLKTPPLSLGVLSLQGGRNYFDFFPAPGKVKKGVLLPIIGVKVSKHFLQHSLRPFLPMLNLAFFAIIAGTGLILLRIVLFGKASNFGIRWKFFIGFIMAISVPLLGFWIAVYSFMVTRESFEKIQIRKCLDQDLRSLENGLISNESSLHGKLWQLRQELQKNIDQPGVKITELLRAWEKEGAFTGLYFLERNGFEFKSTLFSSMARGGGNKLSVNSIQAFQVTAIIFLITSQMDCRTMEEWERSLSDFCNRMEEAGKIDKMVTPLIFTLLKLPDMPNTLNTLLMNQGKLIKVPLQSLGKCKICPMLISSGVSGKDFAKGVLNVIFLFEDLAVEYFRNFLINENSSSNQYKGFRIRHAVFKTDDQQKELVPIQPFGSSNQDLKIHAEKALRLGSDFNRREHSEESTLGIAARIFPDYPLVAVAVAEKVHQGEGKKSDAGIVPIMFAASVIAVFLISAGLSRVFLHPLRVFHSGIERISDQDYSVRLDLETGDEFEILSESFNEMSQGLLERERIQRFVPSEVMDIIKSDGKGDLRPGGERVQAAILFSDIRGFTTITEQHSPQDVVEMLNSYFTEMEPGILENGGTIDKYIGDAIHAVFYQRENLPSPCLRACMAGLEMRRRLGELNQVRGKSGKFPVENGIGIDFGFVVSGKIGSRKGRLAFTAIGEAVNDASRLEAESKSGKYTKIMVSGKVSQEIGSQVILEHSGILGSESEKEGIPFYEVRGIPEK